VVKASSPTAPKSLLASLALELSRVERVAFSSTVILDSDFTEITQMCWKPTPQGILKMKSAWKKEKLLPFFHSVQFSSIKKKSGDEKFLFTCALSEERHVL
jgi:hypothetical protein